MKIYEVITFVYTEFNKLNLCLQILTLELEMLIKFSKGISGHSTDLWGMKSGDLTVNKKIISGN